MLQVETDCTAVDQPLVYDGIAPNQRIHGQRCDQLSPFWRRIPCNCRLIESFSQRPIHVTDQAVAAGNRVMTVFVYGSVLLNFITKAVDAMLIGVTTSRRLA